MSSRRRDPILAVGLFAASVGELLIGSRAGLSEVVASALVCLPLAVRERLPWVAFAGLAAGFAFLFAAGREPDTTAEIVALLAVGYTFGSRPSLRVALAGLAALALPLGATAAIEDPAEVLWIVGIFVVPPWVAGRLVGDRRRRIGELEELNARLERERGRSAELAARLERARLAHDIEIVLAASMRRVAAAAERGERAIGADPAAARSAFEEIRAAGTEAVAELRRLLGLLRAAREAGARPPARPGSA